MEHKRNLRSGLYMSTPYLQVHLNFIKHPPHPHCPKKKKNPTPGVGDQRNTRKVEAEQIWESF